MENNKRKRGISLIHHGQHQLVPSAVPVPQPSQLPPTRFHYPRYPLAPNHNRSFSAPKPTVNFCYITNPVIEERSLVPTPLQMRQVSLVTSEVYRIQQTHRTSQRSQRSKIHLPQETDNLNPDLEIYQSYQHCKQVIGKKLFGQSGVKKNTTNPIVQRTNRFQQFLHPDSFIITDRSENKEQFISPFTQIGKSPLLTSEKVNMPTVKQDKEISGWKKAEIKQMSIQNIENIKIEPQPKQVVQPRKKKNPVSLIEMEKRLLEIIKICDQSL